MSKAIVNVNTTNIKFIKTSTYIGWSSITFLPLLQIDIQLNKSLKIWHANVIKRCISYYINTFNNTVPKTNNIHLRNQQCSDDVSCDVLLRTVRVTGYTVMSVESSFLNKY